jgi:Ca-activated chloride channel family protein
MIHFAHPWCLALLVIPLALALWEWRGSGRRVLAPFDHAGLPSGLRLRRLVDLAGLLPALLLAVVVLLMARPQRSETPPDDNQLTNIQFCLDVSGSMMAPFGEGNRSQAAIRSVQEFTQLRPRDAFGLTIFGNEALHWIPLTRDLSAIRLAAPFLRPEMMPPYLGGTAIGKALESVRTVLESCPEGDRMIILVSDGESADLYGGRAEQIGDALRRAGIVVYYIHVAPGQPQSETGSLVELTGGRAFTAGDPVALREVFFRIDRMQRARRKPLAPEWVDDPRGLAMAGLGILATHLLAAFGIRYTPW